MADQFNSAAVRVSMPLRNVLALYDMVEDYPVVKARLRELEFEVDALRSIQSNMMTMLGDLKNNRR